MRIFWNQKKRPLQVVDSIDKLAKGDSWCEAGYFSELLREPRFKAAQLAMATGSFAIPHCGHLAMLESARLKLSGFRACFVVADSARMIARCKFRTPDTESCEFAAVDDWIRAHVMTLPDWVMAFAVVDTPEERAFLVERVKPSVFVRGTDTDEARPFEFPSHPVLRVPCLKIPGSEQKVSSSLMRVPTQ
jgi:bifunctional ADP-heptose synthase (sugar kinase/adenylyltransferase)